MNRLSRKFFAENVPKIVSNVLNVYTIPSSLGQRHTGVAMGPNEVLYTNALSDTLTRSYDDVTLMNVMPYKNECIERFSQRLHGSAVEDMSVYEKHLFLGGDHAISIGTIGALVETAGEDLGVLWVDSHADVNTPAMSLSGNVHGMSLAYLLGLVSFDYQVGKTRLKPEQLVYIGLKDVDPLEQQVINHLGIKTFDHEFIRKHGMNETMKQARDHFKERSLIHVSMDIDVMTPSLAPCTGTPVENGLEIGDFKIMMQHLVETRKLWSMDFVEFNPCLATNDAELAISLATSQYIIRGLMCNSI